MSIFKRVICWVPSHYVPFWCLFFMPQFSLYFQSLLLSIWWRDYYVYILAFILPLYQNLIKVTFLYTYFYEQQSSDTCHDVKLMIRQLQMDLNLIGKALSYYWSYLPQQFHSLLDSPSFDLHTEDVFIITHSKGVTQQGRNYYDFCVFRCDKAIHLEDCRLCAL